MTVKAIKAMSVVAAATMITGGAAIQAFAAQEGVETPGAEIRAETTATAGTVRLDRVEGDAIQPRVTAIKLSIFLCLNLTVSLFLRVHRMIVTGIIFRYSHHPSEWNLLGSCVAKRDPEL